jgi:hypothetical protein
MTGLPGYLYRQATRARAAAEDEPPGPSDRPAETSEQVPDAS